MTGPLPPQPAAELRAPFTTTTHRGASGIVCLAAAGEVDLDTSGVLHEAIRDVLSVDGVTELVVDLDAVTFLDAAGISALLTAQQQAAQSAVGYRIVNPHGIVHRVLDITGTLALLTPTR